MSKLRKATRLEIVEQQFNLARTMKIYDDSIARLAIHQSESFITQEEAEDLLKKLSDRKDFNVDGFIDFLDAVEAIKEMKTAGGSLIRINSAERIRQVTNDEKYIPEVQSILDQMLELREKLNPMIKGKAVCSIALKNIIPDDEKESIESAPTPAELV